MESRRRVFPEFTSTLSPAEKLSVLAYLPMHVVLLPGLFRLLYERGVIGVLWANVLLYAIGFLYLTAVAFRFLRRDFDPLTERPLFVLRQVCGSYLAMLACNMLAGLLIVRLTGEVENANNDALQELVDTAYGPMKAALVYLAPLTEELLFRAGIFGTLRRKNRVLAYVMSMLAFSVYHVWRYAVGDPGYWVFLLQYLPAGWLLARCYERTNSIWGSIFFHMLTNFMARELYSSVLRSL